MAKKVTKNDIEKNNKEMQALLDDFNAYDDPAALRKMVLGSFDETNSGIKPLTKKQAQDLFGDEITDEELLAMREEAERNYAIKHGLIAASSEGKTKQSKRTQVSKRKSGLEGTSFTPEVKTRQIEEKFEEKYLPQTETLKSQADEIYKNTLKSSNFTQERVSLDDFDRDFEYNFLISTTGVLNGEILSDIMRDSWDARKEYKPKENKKDEDEAGSFGAGLGNFLKTVTGFVLLKKLFGKAFKSLRVFKNFKKKLLTSASKSLEKFKAVINKKIIRPFIDWLKGFIEGLKNLWKTIKGGTKTALKAAKNGVKTASKWLAEKVTPTKNLITGSTAAKSGAETVKNLAKTTKETTKQVAKKAGGKGLAKLTGKIPLIGAAVETGFAISDIKDIQGERGSSFEEATDAYMNQLREEELHWYDPVLNPGKIAAKLNVDKATGWIGEGLTNLLMGGDRTKESFEERNARILKQKKAQQGNPQENTQTMMPPDFITSPDIRETQTRIVEAPTQTPVPRQQTSIYKPFPKDSNELPMAGFGYLADF